MKAAADQKAGSSVKKLATNRKAFRDYEVIEKFEAGIALQGSEVKSIRAGRFSLAEAHARVVNGEVILFGLHIQPYEFSRVEDQVPARPKKLLLHRREIDRLFGKATIKGSALVPLQVYFKRGLVKVEMGLCKGRQSEDKREVLKRKTADREAERAIAARMKR